jgi:hypothetical protein
VPSDGLTGLQLSRLLRDFGLPPIVYRMGALPRSGQEPPVPAHAPDADAGTWDTTAVAVICRFINSGFPVLVATHHHAFTIIGYTRYGARPWARFLRHDDQRGPYLIVDDILDDVDPATGHRHTPWQMLMAPVPDKLWLSPEAAERVGREFLLAYDEFEGGRRLAALRAEAKLAFRTYATTGHRYKEQATIRQLGNSAAREVRLARLSRLLWVVEAVDRDRRHRGQPSVLGEIVFDPTSSDMSPRPLIVRVRGALLVQQTDGTIRSPLPSTDEPVLSAARLQP